MEGFLAGYAFSFKKNKEENITIDEKMPLVFYYYFLIIDWILKDHPTFVTFFNNFKKRTSLKYGSYFKNFNEKVMNVDKLLTNNNLFYLTPLIWCCESIEELKVNINKIFSSNEEKKDIAIKYLTSLFLLKNNLSKNTFIKYFHDNYNIHLLKFSETKFVKSNFENNLFIILKQILVSENFNHSLNKIMKLTKDSEILALGGAIAEIYFNEKNNELILDSKKTMPKYFKDLIGKLKNKAK